MTLKHLMTLDGRQYGKTEARQLMKTILNSNRMGAYLRDGDFQVVTDILAYHPESNEKIGCGISEIQIVREPKYGHRRFEIIRTDGSRQDFSYIKCASTPSNAQYEDAMKAFRYTIWSQTRSFKENVYGGKKHVRCAITGLNIQKHDCEIDHAPPMTFSVLVFNFLKKEGLTLSDVKVKDTKFIACLDFVDAKIKSKWQAYHKTNAILRATLDHANRGQKRVKVDWSSL